MGDPAVALDREPVLLVSCSLPPSPASVPASRGFTRSALRDWGMNGLIEAAELVVAELVTNALRHGVPDGCRPDDHCVRLTLFAHDSLVTCQVADPLRVAGPVLATRARPRAVAAG